MAAVTHNGFGPAAGQALPELDETQLRQWAILLEQRTGLSLEAIRPAFLGRRLRQRMGEVGCGDYQQYYDWVRSLRRGAAEWSVLIDRITIPETRFFRHPSSYALLREQFFPNWQARHHGGIGDLQMCSVGCATGEEAYSLLLMSEQIQVEQRTNHYVGVTGIDISTTSLSQARRGVYHRRRLADVPPELLARYFRRVDDEHLQIDTSLRRRACFTRLNVQEWRTAPLGGFDVIFCQNLLIYFDRAHRYSIADALAHRLRPGGMVIFGGGELPAWSHPDLERISYPNTLAYRRRNIMQDSRTDG